MTFYFWPKFQIFPFLVAKYPHKKITYKTDESDNNAMCYKNTKTISKVNICFRAKYKLKCYLPDRMTDWPSFCRPGQYYMHPLPPYPGGRDVFEWWSLMHQCKISLWSISTVAGSLPESTCRPPQFVLLSCRYLIKTLTGSYTISRDLWDILI